MNGPVLCCADGSDLSNDALKAGLELLGSNGAAVVVTVISDTDPTLVTGTGIAGGTMSPSEFEKHEAELLGDGTAIVRSVSELLSLDPSTGVVLRGSTGPSICAY